jgi:hypothetical protein
MLEVSFGMTFIFRVDLPCAQFLFPKWHTALVDHFDKVIKEINASQIKHQSMILGADL